MRNFERTLAIVALVVSVASLAVTLYFSGLVLKRTAMTEQILREWQAERELNGSERRYGGLMRNWRVVNFLKRCRLDKEFPLHLAVFNTFLDELTELDPDEFLEWYGWDSHNDLEVVEIYV